MSPDVGPDVPSDEVLYPKAPERHTHVYKPYAGVRLTAQQLRKLSLYHGSGLQRCECGFIRLADYDPPLVYSRNGSRVRESA